MRNGKILDWVAKVFVLFIISFMFINIATLLVSEEINLFAIDSPLLFAFLIGITMLICFIITVLGEFKADRTANKAPEDSTEEVLIELRNVFLYTLGIFIYSLLVRKLHFMLASIAFLSVTMIMLNTNEGKIASKAGKAAVASIFTVPILYYVFHGIFNVMLP
jgi:hypothetical protein